MSSASPGMARTGALILAVYTSANIDAKAAAGYLAGLEQVFEEQISVMGWSQGGTNALLRGP